MNNEFIFIWKKCIFYPFIKKTKLILEWIVLSQSHFTNTQCLNKASKSYSLLEGTFDEYFSTAVPEISRTTLDMSVVDIYIVNIFFSFDMASLCNIPVILLKCKEQQGILDPTKSQSWQLYLVGVRETVPNGTFMPHKQSAGLTTSQLKSQFELIKLRKFVFNERQCAINKNMLTVMPNYQILFIDDSVRTLVIMYQGLSSKVTNHQEVKFSIEEKPEIDLNILDVFHEYKSGISYVLVGNAKNKICLCFQISYGLNREGRLRIPEYDIKQISLNMFLSPDFIPILIHVQIMSVSSAFGNAILSGRVISTIYLLTMTGYAIKIVNGVMRSGVNIKGYLDAKQCAEVWEKSSCIRFIQLKECDDITAVQFDQYSCVIDWSIQKVIQTWSPVLTTSNHNDQDGCPESLLVVLRPQDNSHQGGKSLLHHLKESEILIVTQEGMNRAGHEGVKDNLNITQLDKELTQLEYPLKALRFQQKISESSLRETEQLLHSKISFITTSWKSLSQTFTESGHNTFHECLVPLFSGTTESRPLTTFPLKFGHLHPFRMWKRIFGHQIIVGLSVRNDCARSVSDISLRLIPSLHSGTQTGNTMSQSSWKSHQTDLRRENSTALLPGQSTDICCHLDFSLSFTGDSVMLLAFVCYQMVDSKEVIPEYVEELYSEIIITSEDLINRTYCIDQVTGSFKNEIGSSLSLVDLQALDAIQTCHTLSVQSIISSVGCLVSILVEHPSFVYIELAKQYIVVASSQLKMCRVQLQEQISKHKVDIKIFARSAYETLLLVKLLNSLLPDDVTLLPGKVPETYFEKSSQDLLEKMNSYIKCIRQTLTEESPNNRVSDQHCTVQRQMAGKSLSDISKAAVEDMESSKFEDVPKVKKSKLS